MKITPEIIGSIDPKIAKKALRYFYNADNRASHEGYPGARINTQHFAQYTGLNFRSISRYLVEHNLLEQIRYRKYGRSYTLYRPTQIGRSVALAQVRRRLSRGEIDALWETTWAKIEEVNQSDRFLCEFKLFIIFGSFLKDQTDYGDLDLAIVTHKKNKFIDLPTDILNELHLRSFPADHRHMVPHIQACRRAERYVKGRSQRVELHWVNDFLNVLKVNAGMAYRVVIGDLDTYREPGKRQGG